MRRATIAIALGLAFASYALPQEAPAANENHAEQGDPMIWWKWANFAILAVGLGYLTGKHVPPLFRKQSQEIQNALAKSQAAVLPARRPRTGTDSNWRWGR